LQHIIPQQAPESPWLRGNHEEIIRVAVEVEREVVEMDQADGGEVHARHIAMAMDGILDYLRDPQRSEEKEDEGNILEVTAEHK
jgi:hypothetical protein